MINYNKLFSTEEKEKIKNDYINNHLSGKEIMQKYNIKSKDFVYKLLGTNKRSISEANKLARQKFPTKFLHSPQTKLKMRENRLKYMKEHPEQTAWRSTNFSYPEKQFAKFLEQFEYTKKFQIIREYSIYPYYIDFAFVDQKLAIEIDGSQHLLPERKMKDNLKDNKLQSLGWKVLRITENMVKTDWNTIHTTIQSILVNENSSTCNIGIFTHVSGYKKKKRGLDNLTDAQRLSINKQKVNLNVLKEKSWKS